MLLLSHERARTKSLFLECANKLPNSEWVSNWLFSKMSYVVRYHVLFELQGSLNCSKFILASGFTSQYTEVHFVTSH